MGGLLIRKWQEFLIRNDRESQWGKNLRTQANQSKPIYNVNIQESNTLGMMWFDDVDPSAWEADAKR